MNFLKIHIHRYILFLIYAVIITACGGGGSSSGSTTPTNKNIIHVAPLFTTFSINNHDGVINQANHTILVTLPLGTNVQALTPTFTTTTGTVTVDFNLQTSGQTPQDFTTPVLYAITTDDGTIESYVITVVTANISTKQITAFSIDNAPGVISENNHTIMLTLPSGSSVTSLAPTFTDNGVQVLVNGTSQQSGVSSVDFTSPVTYTVVGDDASTQDYIVTITIAPATAKALTQFVINDVAASIDESNHLITETLPFGTSVESLVPVFNTTGVQVLVNGTSQQSGISSVDFTSPVTYTVDAADGSSQNYTVTVIVAKNSVKQLTAFSIGLENGSIDDVRHTITIGMPSAISRSGLVATFSTNGVSVTVGGIQQTSNTTPNNFTNQLVYTVIAADGSTQDYTVITNNLLVVGLSNWGAIEQWNGSTWQELQGNGWKSAISTLFNYKGTLIVGLYNGTVEQWDYTNGWTEIQSPGAWGSSVSTMANYKDSLVVGLQNGAVIQYNGGGIESWTTISPVESKGAVTKMTAFPNSPLGGGLIIQFANGEVDTLDGTGHSHTVIGSTVTDITMLNNFLFAASNNISGVAIYVTDGSNFQPNLELAGLTNYPTAVLTLGYNVIAGFNDSSFSQFNGTKWVTLPNTNRPSGESAVSGLATDNSTLLAGFTSGALEQFNPIANSWSPLLPSSNDVISGMLFYSEQTNNLPVVVLNQDTIQYYNGTNFTTLLSSKSAWNGRVNAIINY